MKPGGFAHFLDRASTELLRLEEENRLPEGLQVHPAMYELMAGVRRRELADGYPLLVLGLPVEADEALSAQDYRIVH